MIYALSTARSGSQDRMLQLVWIIYGILRDSLKWHCVYVRVRACARLHIYIYIYIYIYVRGCVRVCVCGLHGLTGSVWWIANRRHISSKRWLGYNPLWLITSVGCFTLLAYCVHENVWKKPTFWSDNVMYSCSVIVNIRILFSYPTYIWQLPITFIQLVPLILPLDSDRGLIYQTFSTVYLKKIWFQMFPTIFGNGDQMHYISPSI